MSEANAADQQRTSSMRIASVSLGSASVTDSIAIDVGVIDAGTGDILDAALSAALAEAVTQLAAGFRR